MVVPLGMSNIDDKMWLQYIAFGLSLAMGFQWMSTSFFNSTTGDYEGLKVNFVQPATPLGQNYSNAIGPIMLNFAILTIIPSWVNIKVYSLFI